MKRQEVVTVTDLKKTYGSGTVAEYTALKGINFSVNQGDFVGIMGASGSGKTTLLNLLATLDQPTSGQIQINDQSIAEIKRSKLSDFRANELGFIFQDFNLLENLTARENISLPLTLNNQNKIDIDARVDQVAQDLNLTDYLEQYPGQLSGGQQQRVAAARALIHQPKLILADEPTGALDSENARGLMELLTNINQSQGVSILMVTHDPFSASFCRRILMIRDGIIGQTLQNESRDRKQFYSEILKDLGTYR